MKKCMIEKKLFEFCKNKNRKDGYKNSCKEYEKKTRIAVYLFGREKQQYNKQCSYCSQPAGQRPQDLIKWAEEILEKYKKERIWI